MRPKIATKRGIRKAQGKTKPKRKRLYIKRDRYGNVLGMRYVRPLKRNKGHKQKKKRKNKRRRRIAKKSRQINRRKKKGLSKIN